MTRATLAATASSTPGVPATDRRPGSLLASTEHPDDLVDHRGRNLRLPAARHGSLSRRREDHDLVRVAVEADAVLAHIVVDDQVEPFAGELLARARQAAVAGLGSEAHEHLAVLAALTERLQHVGRRLELERPARVV